MDIVTAVRSLCFVSAGLCLLRILTEGTRLKKQTELVFKLVFSLVFASMLINGFRNTELQKIPQIDVSDYSHAKAIYRNELAKKAADNISNILYSQLEAAGIEVEKVETDINISENGNININRIIISSSDPESAEDLIRKSLGQETEVINGMG